jgi:hypothetical protein
MSLPKAINFVDGTVAAPTTVDGDIYILTGSGVVDSSWGGAAFGDWVRFLNTFATPITPLDGYLCFDVTAATWMQYDGSVWAVFGGGGGDTIFTGGTMAAPSTVTMATNALSFLGGKVGFGKTAPVFNVHIEDVESSNLGLKIENSTNLKACTINTGGDIHLYDASGTNVVKISESTTSFFNTGANFGFGTISPSFNIHIEDVIDSNNGLKVGNATNSRSFIINTGGEPTMLDSAGVQLFRIWGGSDSFIHHGGDFGIGLNTGLAAKLHIKGPGITSGTAALLVQNNSGLDLLRTKDDGTISAANLSTYASDFAAGVGGLVANDIYKTSTGELRIKT